MGDSSDDLDVVLGKYPGGGHGGSVTGSDVRDDVIFSFLGGRPVPGW
jgi:hypothetical protein